MDRIDLISLNGGDGEHYCTASIDGVVYRKNPNCIYALYLHVKTGSWRVSALVKNDELEVGNE